MTTYTIATYNDMLLATAPDGDRNTLTKRVEDAISDMNNDTGDQDAAREYVVYHTGLTLFSHEEDARDSAEELGGEVIYTGTERGWLEDKDGATGYEAAIRF